MTYELEVGHIWKLYTLIGLSRLRCCSKRSGSFVANLTKYIFLLKDVGQSLCRTKSPWVTPFSRGMVTLPVSNTSKGQVAVARPRNFVVNVVVQGIHVFTSAPTIPALTPFPWDDRLHIKDLPGSNPSYIKRHKIELWSHLCDLHICEKLNLCFEEYNKSIDFETLDGSYLKNMYKKTIRFCRNLLNERSSNSLGLSRSNCL
jgi:hypothetical protein